MKNLVSILFGMIMILVTEQAFSAQCLPLSSVGFTDKQINVLHRAFQYGKKHNMAYSLAAIAWKESSAGVNLRNPRDPSAGVFHVTVRNALHYAGWENTEPNQQVMYELLQLDFDTSANYAIKNLTFWRDAYKVGWKKTWQYYNGGRSYSEASRKYAEDIAAKVRKIKSCNWR